VRVTSSIDRDGENLQAFDANIFAQGKRDSADVIVSSFESVTVSGVVVYFEFCLHEMTDPYGALTHARALARNIVVFDHFAGSDWSFYAAEEDKVWRSTDAMKRFGIRRCQIGF